MEIKTDSKLTRWVVAFPLIGIFVTTFILINIFLDWEKNTHKENLIQSRKDIIKQSKFQTKKRVLGVASYIEASKKVLTKESKYRVKSIVDLTIEAIDTMYRKKVDLSKEQKIKMIVEYLRDIRFFSNRSGYFFIYDMQGKSLLLPTHPSLEGTNLLNLKDAKGTYTIREHLEIVKKSKEGFHEWYWYKPDSDVMKKKIGFVKVHEGLGIYVGTARYEEDIIQSVKIGVQKLLMNIRHDEKGQIFVYDYRGNTISHANKELIGTNRWNFTIKDNHIVQNFIKGAKTAQEGFFLTHLEAKSDKEVYKTSFIKDIPELSWVIGAGIYNADTLKKVELKHAGLRDKLSETIKRAIYTVLLVSVLIFIMTLLLAFKLRNIIKRDQKSLIVKHKQTIEQKKCLVHQLEHDHLTGLPNRIMLTQRLDQAIALSKRAKREVAIMFIDIDNFKIINDSVGHDVGDTVLKEVGIRIKNSIRETDMVARFGGDEFVVLVDDYQNIHNIMKIIGKIEESIKMPIVARENKYRLTLSIGISIFPDDGGDSLSLFKNADIAMYKAKESGKNGHRFFTKYMNDEVQDRIEIESSLQVACKKEEFVLHYQPIIDTSLDKIIGVEALIRWEHPVHGLLYPDKFISIAEESNFIVEIGEWVIDEALKQMVQWKSKGYGIEKIAINLASRQLESEGLVEYIKDALRRHSCEASWFEVEVVERQIMDNSKNPIRTLRRLKGMGIDIAIDDFGTGYSSLAYLKNLPVTKLKIDRAFVMNLDKSFEDNAIVKTVIALGNGLFMKILAEGVETQKQKIVLNKLGCNLMQGYLFGKPLVLDEIEKLLDADMSKL